MKYIDKGRNKELDDYIRAVATDPCGVTGIEMDQEQE